jgi:signal transduction histidine kinase
MTENQPSVLLLEDDAGDALLIEDALRRQFPDLEMVRAATRTEYEHLLDDRAVDVVLSDGSVPGCEGIEAYYLARDHSSQVRFMFVSGNDAPDLRGLKALGISDFLPKDDLDDIGPALARALHPEHGAQHAEEQATLLAGYELLVDTVRELSTARDLSAIMRIVRSAARRITGADGATFVLREGDLCHYADEDAVGPLWKGQKFLMDACISGWAMQHRQPAVVDDIYVDPRMNIQPYRDTFVRSMVVVPVRAKQPVAAIGNYWAALHEPTAAEVKLLQALADTTAVAMENVEMYQGLEAKVAERTRELEMFTYAVSHDLRAPIRHLEGFARILLTGKEELPASTQHGIERIRGAAVNMREMVNGLLTLSRMSQAELRRQEVDLAQLAREVALELAAESEHDVDFRSAESLPVIGDRGLLRDVLENLLGNAWKFTARTLQPSVELGARIAGPGGPVEYYVRDNGAGFDPASAGKLFGVFQRLHRDEDFAGTGVGLASVQRVIAKHGGTVRATGEPGKGATFAFTLPDGPGLS